jgi:cephalosporin hydroxylase
MSSSLTTFEERNQEFIRKMGKDEELKSLTRQWFDAASRQEYSYHFSWMGRPIIQFPQDIVAMQELIWQIQPDLIIETGIAHGGSLIFYASMLELIGKGEILGIDIDIRDHNRSEIEKHPMFNRISMVQGSSTDPEIVGKVSEIAKGKQTVMVVLDSNHTHDHVARELELYAPLVTKGSYLVVFDTVVEYLPKELFPNRPWGPGDNPMTAVREFLKVTDRFEIDEAIHNKLLITVAPDGYLKCTKD